MAFVDFMDSKFLSNEMSKEMKEANLIKWKRIE